MELEPRTEGRVMNLVLAPGQRKRPAKEAGAKPAAAQPAASASGQGGATPRPVAAAPKPTPEGAPPRPANPAS
jgi:hypothetical protein